MLVYVGSSKFHSQARTSVNVIIKIADDASEIIHNVTRALEDLVESGISAEVSENLNSSAKKMDNVNNNIVKKKLGKISALLTGLSK